MVRIADILSFLKEFAPPALAEEWDNVGLLIGDERRETSAAMTCLTLTPDVAAEAIQKKAGLVITHHPVLFRPVQRLTAETPEGKMLLDLIAAGIAVYSPHTGYDSARDGINRQLAELLELTETEVLRPLSRPDEERLPPAQRPPGAGRCGNLPVSMTLREFNQKVKQRLGVPHVQYVGEPGATLQRVGIACGSAAEFLRDAREQGCQVLLTGEARFHACLEAAISGMALVLPGHYATERPALEKLAATVARQFPGLAVWASESERDPLQWD